MAVHPDELVERYMDTYGVSRSEAKRLIRKDLHRGRLREYQPRQPGTVIEVVEIGG